MKRFYKDVSVHAVGGGHVVHLDARTLKTPGKAALVLPTRALAEAVAWEWDAQESDIKPDSMPQMQYASTAIDRVAERHGEVAAEVAAFGGTDLLCYRADEPEDLVSRQAAVWDPYLDWARDALDAPLAVTAGIMPVKQDEAVLARLHDVVAGHDAFELTALHALTNGLGSLILALAFMRGHRSLDDVWQASILDAIHQEESWGTDWEAEEKRDRVLADLKAVEVFISHLRNKSLESA